MKSTPFSNKLINKSLTVVPAQEKLFDLMQFHADRTLTESNQLLLSLNLPPLAEGTALLLQLDQYLDKNIVNEEVEYCLGQMLICLRSMHTKLPLSSALISRVMNKLLLRTSTEKAIEQLEQIASMLKNWADWYDMELRYSERNQYRYTDLYIEATKNSFSEADTVMSFLLNPGQTADEIINLLLDYQQRNDNKLLIHVLQGFWDNNIYKIWETQMRSNINLEKVTQWINFILDLPKDRISKNQFARCIHLLRLLPNELILKVIQKHPELYQDFNFQMSVIGFTDSIRILSDFILSQANFYNILTEHDDSDFFTWKNKLDNYTLSDNPDLLVTLVHKQHGFVSKTLIPRYNKLLLIDRLFIAQAKHLDAPDFIEYLLRLSELMEDKQKHMLMASVIALSYVHPELKALEAARNHPQFIAYYEAVQSIWATSIFNIIIHTLDKQNRWQELDSILQSLSQLNIYPQEKNLILMHKLNERRSRLYGATDDVIKFLPPPHDLDTYVFGNFIETLGTENPERALQWSKLYYRIENEEETTQYIMAFPDYRMKGEMIPVKPSQIKSTTIGFIHAGTPILLDTELMDGKELYIPIFAFRARKKPTKIQPIPLSDVDLNYDYCRYLALKHSFVSTGNIEILDTISPCLHNEAIQAWFKHNTENRQQDLWLKLWKHGEKIEDIGNNPMHPLSEVARHIGYCVGKHDLTPESIRQWRNHLRFSMHGYFITGIIEAQSPNACLTQDWSELIPDFLNFPQAVATNLYKAGLCYLVENCPEKDSVTAVIQGWL